MRSKHIGAWLLSAACAVVMLALLSALIVSPEADAPVAPMPEPNLLTASIMPYALPAPDAQPDAPKADAAPRGTILAPAQAVSLPDALSARTDANGHVIAHRSYLRSVYQAFRQDTACG